jgi:thiol:disulfide interchange protein
MSIQQTPPARKPRSPLMILGQSMFFIVALVLIGSISIRLLMSRPVNGPVAAAIPDHIPWRTDFASALEESKKTGKPVLVDFSAGWCPPCQQMKHDSWPDPRVGKEVTSGYIPVLMDADSPGSRAPGGRYNIQTIPAILVLDSSGNIVRQAGFMSADELLNFLKQGSQPG